MTLSVAPTGSDVEVAMGGAAVREVFETIFPDEALAEWVRETGVELRDRTLDELVARDLELSTGMIEGAVRYVVSQRLGEGGMCWIKERAEALVQLRCIQINGDWEQFVAFAHERTLREQADRHPRVIQNRPEPLPTFGLAA